MRPQTVRFILNESWINVCNQLNQSNQFQEQKWNLLFFNFWAKHSNFKRLFRDDQFFHTQKCFSVSPDLPVEQMHKYKQHCLQIYCKPGIIPCIGTLPCLILEIGFWFVVLINKNRTIRICKCQFAAHTTVLNILENPWTWTFPCQSSPDKMDQRYHKYER